MTGSGPSSANDPIERAVGDLEHLREVLQAAGPPDELREALQSYWRTNRRVLTALAAAVGEQLRAQALQALYEWRTNLDDTLPSHRRPGT
ncbi:hypothetical protein AB0E69_38230 [Kribbella sp. NPDC026611]|uniref:hypothetical protein n=1 Tax=Kribbella sp. NPDC026611 TaxID=3154911 RepID=UPI0033DBB9AC